MRIFIFEYYGNHIGGAVVVLAENALSAMSLVETNLGDEKVISDIDLINHYRIKNYLYSKSNSYGEKIVDGVNLDKALNFLRESLELLVDADKEKFYKEYAALINDKENQLRNRKKHKVRIDWMLSGKILPRGLYFLSTLAVTQEPFQRILKEGIISDTYCCA